MIHKLLNNVALVTNGLVERTYRHRGEDGGLVQVEITGAATVVLQGRAAPDAPWVDVFTTTVSAASGVMLFPQMRAIVSARTSGNISVWLVE